MVGDVREQLALLPDASVQCVVTSPPYFGLRDYGTASWDGGDANCDHVGMFARTAAAGTDKQASNRGAVSVRSGDCQCGARRIDTQIGLEQTPDEFVAALVDVFREVRRVLKDDGTLWLNLGDSYAANHGGAIGATSQRAGRSNVGKQLSAGVPEGLKPKDLIGVPWRVAFALQADGWYLRSDVIWHKPNPMPESVTDRPTKAHEYIFLLTKSDRYFYDAAAIAEPADQAGRIRADRIGGNKYGEGVKHSDGSVFTGGETRNCRSVWSIALQPYPDAHFATFPEELPEKCIKAGCRLGDMVLDPFCGSGTTGQVAIQLGRSFIGIELNPAYAALAQKRIGGAAPLFAAEAAS